MYKVKKSFKATTIILAIAITVVLALTLFTGCKAAKSTATTKAPATTTTTEAATTTKVPATTTTKASADNSNNKTFHVTSSSDKGGTITPKGEQSVKLGDSITFNISIDSGYKLAWLRVDNAKVNNFTGNSYTFDNVTKNHTIQAHFSKTSK